MLMFLSDNILWIKAFHVIFVIAWMSGMLYLPRLFVYHTETEPGSAESERFKRMEQRLLRIIVNPSMIAVWILGLTMAYVTDAWGDVWLQIKIALVILMSALHGLYAMWVKAFARDANTRSAKFYRIVNEVPFLLLIGIVIMVIVKPFE